MRKFLAFLCIPLVVAGCATSPTSGKSIFAGLVSTQQENEVGSSERQNILKQYHGISDNQAMNQFVNQVGFKLVPYAERKDVSWTFTVLNDDIVNAFAVPGGYIYITRGLLNLAQDESQVAAVLGHEIGHINARHSAQQMSQTMVANIGLQVLGIATGSNAATQLGNVGADLFIKRYSREHELEADALAIRYLAAAGYDPYANTKFLDLLEKYTQLQQRMAGSQAGSELGSFFATHPPTPERVVRARQIADQTPKVANPVVNRDAYLQAVDGTIYGDTADQGFVRGKEFIHPGLKIRFTVPEGFVIKNGDKQVVAQNGKNAAMIFDMANGANDDPAGYLANWVSTAASGQERIEINSLNAATAASSASGSKGTMDVRMIVISAGENKFYRLMFMAPQGQMASYADAFKRATYSFKRLDTRDVALASPNRVRLIHVRNGDTPQSLAEKMSVKDYALERFCLLNGITPNEQLKPSLMIKTVQPF